jgi:hypothetical protein
MRTLKLVILLAVLSPAHGGEVDVSGSVELQTRLFQHDPAWPGQDDQAPQGSVVATTEFRWRNEEGTQRASMIPYFRWDAADDDRSLVDLREAYWAYEGNDFEFLVGANTVFWGVTESVHLVDIINQTDFVGDVDGERERTFAGTNGRFRPPFAIDTDRPVYDSRDEETHLDLALRYSHYIGDVDIGLNIFSGTSREPRFLPAADGQSLLPVYDQIEQFGIDLQYTREAWLWKLEAIARDGVSHSFTAAVGGLEYTMYQVAESTADVGLLLEYQYDGRNEFEPVTIADNDVFVGARIALNDIQDTAVLAGVAYDIDTGETFVNVEAERRFGDNWFSELRLRAFSGAGQADTSYWLQQADYLQFSLTRYF